MKQIFEVPFELLEKNYWSENGFCLSCNLFSKFEGEIGYENECPFCKEMTFYDVDFLMKKEILLGID